MGEVRIGLSRDRLGVIALATYIVLIRDRLEVPIIASLGQRFHRHGNGIIYFCVKSCLFKLKTTSKVNVMHFLDAICNFFF